MDKKFLLYLSLFILILLFVFRNLILNISTNLIDWLDYPYVIWVMSQSINHIQNLDFANFFETNAFYPHKMTLLFSDLLLPQALILLSFLTVSKNLILSFNLTFIFTFILNYISLFLFWKQIFKKDLIAFFGSLFVIFSPFFFMELSHFQMMSYWPFFFAFYFLFKQEEKFQMKNLILIGLLLTVQFLASVYIAVYLIFSIIAFYFLKWFFQKQSKPIFMRISLIFLIFAVSCGIFIKGYSDMRAAYNIKRNIEEYINYSAHLTDYVFTKSIKSTLHQSPLMQYWNGFDKNQRSHSSFPGFLIFVLGIYAIFKITRSKHLLTINLELNREKSFFLILLITGLVFSLGPRLNFNGNYAHIPLPYNAVVNFIPGAEAVRVPVRWSFLFFLGFIYFSLITLNKLNNKKFSKLIFTLIFMIFILEYLPLSVKSEQYFYKEDNYQILQENCSKEKKVLLELPLTHLDAYPNIYEGLRYLTVMEFSSIQHQCFLVNGYSGYDLPENFALSATLSKYIENQQTEEFLEELISRNVDYVKFNRYYFIKELKPFIIDFINEFSIKNGVEKINEDLFYIRKPF